MQFGKFSFTDQQIIEDAVKDGIVVVQQDYKLQNTETGEFFGLNGNRYFGRTYSLAVKCTGGYYLGRAALTPWEYDRYFDKYRNDPKYRGVISTTQYCAVADTLYRTLDSDGQLRHELPGGYFCKVDDKAAFGGQGFVADTSSTRTDGWIVLLTARKPLTGKQDNPLSFICYRQQIEFEPDQEHCAITPVAVDEVVGGLYIRTQITGIGQITMSLVGLVHVEKDKWTVDKLTSVNNVAATPELTPIKESGDKSVSEVVTTSENGRKKNER